MKYLLPGLLFLANSEVISMLALLIMMGMFLWDIARARFGDGRDVSPTRSAGAPFRQGGQKGWY